MSLLDGAHHAACVDSWLERSAKDLAPDALLHLFEAALDAFWARTRLTLGEFTLTAIADRVLYNAAEQFPLFSALKVDPNGGIQLGELRERLSSRSHPELLPAIRFVLVELLTVLGNLTAEILTAELHKALSSVADAESSHAERGAPGKPTPPVSPGSGEPGS